MHFSFSMFLSVSRYIPGQTVFVSFSMFLFQFSHNIPGPTGCISHFSPFSVFLAIYQVIQNLRLIFHVFQNSCQNKSPTFVFLIFQDFHCFLPHSRSYSVCFSFSMIFSFLLMFLVLLWAFHIFNVFECFSPYFRSYSVHFSFFTFFSVSHHILGPTMKVSNFPRLSVF